MVSIPKQIRVSAVIYTLIGIACCAHGFFTVHPADLENFLLYLLFANITGLGLRLTASDCVIPASFLILLLGFENLSAPELVVIATTVTVFRKIPKVRRSSQLASLLYAIASVTIGVVTAHATAKMISHLAVSAIFPAPMIASSFVLLFNYGLTKTLVADQKTPLIGVYRRECRSLLPWFVSTAYLAYLVRCTSLQTHWHPAIIATPLLFALDAGYRRWSEQKAAHKKELDELHRRTLDTLSIAIESRDRSTQMHLRRVEVYAKELGREFGLSEIQLESLTVAALLHDIGKLGIPDHILLKAGPLNEGEWEKMKAHALIGAEMLTHMKYPESVVEIVRAHHEKWDGSGYPLGLAGDAIPIGARILSAVDCLDALASDRPYRTGLSIAKALKEVQLQMGKSYDPAVVSVLERRITELERQAHQAVLPDQAETNSPQHSLAKLASRLSLESDPTAVPFLNPIISASNENRLLQQLSAELAHELQMEEVVACTHKWLRQLLDYDTLALYVRRKGMIEPAGVMGRSADFFSRSVLSPEESLSGQVAQNQSPLLNGDPEQEAWYACPHFKNARLHSALSVPLGHGALTLYRAERHAFSSDDLRVLQAASVHVGCALQNALRYGNAEESAATDHLTGLANARSLSVHLKRELARTAREKGAIGILVCDLDGFKGVNDRFGHLKGDELLRLVAKGMRETCRASDYVARMGGDEFVVVAPGLTREQSLWYSERLRAMALEAGRMVGAEQSFGMSIGEAIYPVDGHDAEALIAEADRRMYAAKQRQDSFERAPR